MNLFLLVTLSLVLFSNASFPLEKLMQNPKVFASAFANADKDVIAKMLGLVERLLNEGQADKQSAIDAHSDREDEQVAAQSVFDDAAQALADVSAKLANAITARDNLVNLEKDHKAALDAAVKVLNSAKSKKATTKAHMDTTIERVNSEKVSLTNVIGMLNSVKSGSDRRLLSNADPTAVDKVIAEVEKLMEAGAEEVKSTTAAYEEASRKEEEASRNEAAARTQHEKTTGALGKAEGLVNTLTNEKASRRGEKMAAQRVLVAANSALESAASWRDQEVARVQSEKATLEQVKELLAKNAE